MTTHRTGWLRAILTALFVVPALLVPATVPAAGAESAEILIESVAPAIPTRKSELRISGRIANGGDTDIVLPNVQLRLSPLQLNSRDEISQVLNGTTERTGDAVGEVANLGDVISPGQQAEFDLRVKIDDLALPTDLAGVYAVFVELRSGELTLGQSGTVFPWFPPDAAIRATRLAWVWPIVAQPAMAAEELVVDPALPASFAPGGRLNRLLAAGEQLPVAWLVDTATWQLARTMADGYRIPSTAPGAAPDDTEPGDLTDAAGSFADRLQRLVATTPTASMQFAYADVDALQRGGLDSFVVRSATLPEVLTNQLGGARQRTGLFAAPGGATDRPALETMVDSGVRTSLLADTVFPPDPPTYYTPSGVVPLDVAGTQTTGLLTDRLLSNTLDRPLATAAERSRAKQEFLTDTALITLELPNEPRSVIAAPQPTWDPPEQWVRRLGRALNAAPWLRMVGLAEVSAAPAVPRLDLGYPDNQERRELPQGYIERIAALDNELDRLSRVLLDPAGYGESFSLALQRAGSALWRGDVASRNRFVDALEAQVAAQKRKVRVVSAGGTVTLAGDSGVVPLTIANDLDQPVSVGVQFASDNPITLQYTPPEPVRIDAREKVGLEVPVRVAGSQPTTVTVLLTDRDGGLYDDTATLELRSTASSRIAVWIVGIGAVALIVLVTLNLLRRRRSRTEPS